MAGLTSWDWPLTESKIIQELTGLISDSRYKVGNDLVYFPDFRQSFNDLFKKKVYTSGECLYCDQFSDSILHYASTWAAKEAVYKALKQADETLLGWKDIEISREKIAGKPSVTIHKHPGKFTVSLSISHDGDYVWAIALLTPTTAV